MKLKNVEYVEDIEEKGDEFEDLKNGTKKSRSTKISEIDGKE